jgi:hypothetical protein
MACTDGSPGVGVNGSGDHHVDLTGQVVERQGAQGRRGVAASAPGGVPSALIAGLRALAVTDRAFLGDPRRDPTVEPRAADRAHRIGQGTPEFIHRLVSLRADEEEPPPDTRSSGRCSRLRSVTGSLPGACRRALLEPFA